MKPEYINELSLTHLTHVGIDFDNTLVESVFPQPGIGPLLPGAKAALAKLVELGLKPVIYSARPWSDLAAVENFIRDEGLPIKRVFLGKPLFKLYIGDEAYRLKEWKLDWPYIERLLHE